MQTGGEQHDRRPEAALHLGFFRALCFVAAFFYPIFGFLFTISVPGARDPLSARLLFAALPAAVLAASYVSAHVRRRMLAYMNVLYYVLLSHQIYLLRENELAPAYALGFLIAWAGVGASHVRLGQLLVFLVTLLALSALALWPLPRPQLPVLLFLMSLLIISLVLAASLQARLRHEDNMVHAGERLSEEIEQHRLAKNEVLEQKAFLEAILKSVNAEVVVYDSDLRYRFISPSAVRDPGDRERMLGQDDFFYCQMKGRPRAVAERRRSSLQQALEGGATISFEEEFVDGRGLRKHYIRSVSPIRDATGRVSHVVGSGIDITERKITERAIQYMAYHDSLTGLPSREKLQEDFRANLHEQGKGALFFFDLDRFKIINDTLGHAAGDQLLSAVAGRLVRAVGRRGTVYRQGADQFIALCPIAERGEASLVAREMLRSLREPIDAEGHNVHVTAGLGISRYPEDGEGLADLIRHADLAMRRAKGAGQNTFHFVRGALKSAFARRAYLLGGLRSALENEEFIVFYQPRVALESRQIVGMEALVRWRHPQLGIVSPDEFIPLMEESGRIHELGAFVLETGCRQVATWRELGTADLGLSVNCSGTQLQRQDFPDRVARVLRETGMVSSSLELEITESVLMDSASPSRRVMHLVRDMGVGFSIDDFGTGFSSLSYLRHLPVDSIKIDRSFLREIPGDADSVAIVTAIATMAVSLGLELTAEGVEMEEQVGLLKALGCREVQGFLFGKPMPAEEFALLLPKQV